MLIKQAIEQYLNYKKTYTKPKTVYTYNILMAKFATYYEGGELEDINYNDVINFQNYYKEKYAGSHYATICVLLNDMFSYFRKQGILQNIMIIKVPRYFVKSHKPLTYEEYLLLCDTATDDRLLLTVKLLWWTGLRVSELCDIKASEIDLTKREIFIRSKKSNKVRLISWSEDTHNLLKKYITENKPENKLINVSSRTIERWVKELSETARIQDITPHSFRHGIVHHMRKQGVDLEHIQQYIGHTSLHSTIRNYMVWSQQELHDFRQKIEEKICG